MSTDKKKIADRLKRLEGHLAQVRRSIEDGRDCEQVIPQFLAVKGALDSGLEAYLLEELAVCRSNKEEQKFSKLLKLVIKKIRS